MRRFSRQRIAGELKRWLVESGYATRAALPAATRNRGRPAAPRRTHYVVEGPYETSYSLAVVNRNLAARSRRTGSRRLYPAGDGTEAYASTRSPPTRCRRHSDLVGPAPLTPEPIVTIRNTYPPRPNGMLGDYRLIHLAWEESAIPPSVTALGNLHLDGILVPSEYCKRVCA